MPISRNKIYFDYCRQLVEPKDFLRIVKSHHESDISSVKFILPKLGSKSFGKFLITYRYEPLKKINGAKISKRFQSTES